MTPKSPQSRRPTQTPFDRFTEAAKIIFNAPKTRANVKPKMMVNGKKKKHG
jgi:hypothetical protein